LKTPLNLPPVISALIDFIKKENCWEGRYTDLLEILTRKYSTRNKNSWIETAKGMATTIKRYLPLLEILKITITEIEPRKEDGVYINIKYNAQDVQEVQPDLNHSPVHPAHPVCINQKPETTGHKYEDILQDCIKCGDIASFCLCNFIQ
jgi:hypothetical protein